MANPNPQLVQQLQQAQEELAQLKAEKLKLFPPNPHPFAQPDQFPKDYTPEQIQYRNQLVERIEQLEQRIADLQDRMYDK